MTVPTRAVLTAVAAALVAGAAVLGDALLVGVAAALALALALTWPVLLDLPARWGSTVVVGLGGLGGVGVVAVTQEHPFLRELPLVVALAVLLAFVNELARQDGRHRLVESVTGTVSGVLVAAAAAGWVAIGRAPVGDALAISGAMALFLAAAVSAVHFGGWLAAGVTTLAAVVGGAAVGTVMPVLDTVAGGLLGLAVGILVAALHVLFDAVPVVERRAAAVAALLLPVSVSGLVVYIVGRVLVG